jgi:predicted nucleic acid-binding protein
MAALIDTNVLVYRVDPRDRAKQAIATQVLRRGLADDSIRVPHQALVEFMSVVTRPCRGGEPLLSVDQARDHVEELLSQYRVLYPTEGVLRIALMGIAAYQLSWFDAHIWAYAQHHGLAEVISEDFQDGRIYGNVLARNPFAAAAAPAPGRAGERGTRYPVPARKRRARKRS